MNILFAQQKQIVLSVNAPFLLRCAAKRLSDHLGIPCVTDDAAAVQEEILLGNTNRLEKEVRVRYDICRILWREEKVVFAAVHYQPLCEMIDRIVAKGIEGFDPEAAPLQISSCVPVFFGERRLVWNDEFCGNALDTEKWIGRADTDLPDAVMTMNPGTVDVTDGKLVLAAHLLDCRDAASRYLTGYAITTATTMAFTYGYLEIRARIPFCADAKTPDWCVLFDADGACELHREQLAPRDLTADEAPDDWHTYGFLWTSAGITCYLDGFPCAKPYAVQAKSLCLSLRNLPTFADGASAQDLFPFFCQFDYVRLYQLEDECVTLPATVGAGALLDAACYDKRDHGKYRSSTPAEYANGMPYTRADWKTGITKK